MTRAGKTDRGKVEQMEIRQLDKETYAGRKFTARYETKGYYDLRPTERGFEMEYVPFEAPPNAPLTMCSSAIGWRSRWPSVRLRATG